jgi:hypothetical protein
MRFPLLLSGAAACIFIGFALAMALELATPRADAGDWLMAGAGAAGVMLTILTAVGIEQYRSDWRAREELDRLEKALIALDRATIGVPRFFPSAPRASDPPMKIVVEQMAGREIGSQLQRAIAKYRFIIGRADLTDLDLWEALQDLSAAIDLDEARIDSAVATLAAPNPTNDKPAVGRGRTELEDVLRRLEKPITTARDRLRDARRAI